jgi:RNA polymerase sigma factor (sigma-70 family)
VSEHDFEQFVRAERSRVIAFLMFYYRATEQDAEEAVQVALIQALRWWARITDPGAWIRRVSIREYQRLNARTTEEPTSDERLLSMRGVVPSAADSAALNEQERQVLEHLARLPPKQRMMSALRYRGLSQHQIAEELGMTVSAVRQNVLRARSRLRHFRQTSEEDA